MTETQPLLHADRLEIEGRPIPRPDVRNSPDNMLVSVQSEECIGKCHYIYLKRLLAVFKYEKLKGRQKIGS